MDELQITLHLRKIQHLFEMPDITPYSEDYKPYSNKPGIDNVVEKLFVNRKSKNVVLIIVLPSDQIISGLENETAKAIIRYSKAWSLDAKHKMSRANYKGIRGLATAFFGLVILNGAGVWLNNFSNFILSLISDGLIVAGWVLMWFPLDTLTQEFWVYRLERKTYQKLENVRVKIVPDK